MEITIRKAEESDFVQINALFKEFAEFQNSPEKMINSVEMMKAEKDFFDCFVVEKPDGKIIGYAVFFFCYFTWTGKALYMDDLYIKPNFRGSGIGTRLINKVVRYAIETGCHKVRWQVSDWNKPAINFYKKLGAEISIVEQNCDLVLENF